MGRAAPTKRAVGMHRAAVTWLEVAVCEGWAAVQMEVRKIELQHCDGGVLIDNGSIISHDFVTYLFYCAYHNTQNYPWRIRVRVSRYHHGVLDVSVCSCGRQDCMLRHRAHLCLDTCRENGRNGFLMEMASGDRGASAGVDKLKEPCTNAAD